MDFHRLGLTHSEARRSGRPPLFWSRGYFDLIKNMGNTHYCFHCCGHYGFRMKIRWKLQGLKLVKTITIENHKADVIQLSDVHGNAITNEIALVDDALTPFLSQKPRYWQDNLYPTARIRWLKYTAYFEYTEHFERDMLEAGYKISREDPMKDHDVVTHANAVIGNIQRYRYLEDWLHKEYPKVASTFPYTVSIT